MSEIPHTTMEHLSTSNCFHGIFVRAALVVDNIYLLFCLDREAKRDNEELGRVAAENV